MGTVYLAHDRDLRRTVALKVLQKERAENPLLVKRFKAEGQAGAHLQHPHIIGVYESGEIDGYLYLALEYVDGIDLLEWIRKRGPLPVRRSLDIIRQVAEALEHAASKQVVHRDIKPSNIMIKADGTVKLADMGLARIADDTLDTSITRAGTTVGTVDYMSPEQARNSKAADIRSDLYSLGCTWYHMLTGQIPYPEGSLTNKLQAHAMGPIPDPRHLNPQVPEGVSAIIQRLMAKRPEDRYQSPSELLADLRQPYLFRAEVTGDLLAALAGEAADLGDSTDFVLQRNAGKLTPLAVSNSAIDAEVELPDTAAEINPAGGQPVPPQTPAGASPSAAPATGGGGVKRQPAGGSSSKTVSKSSSSASRERSGTSQSEKASSGKQRPLPARTPPPAPAAPVVTTSWGLNFDPARIAFAVAALIVIIVGISWGWQALMSGSHTTDPELAALEPVGEQLPDQPRRPPQPLDILPDPEPAPPAAQTAQDAPRPEPVPFPGMDEFDETSGGLAARLIPPWLRTGWSGLFENPRVYRIDQRGQHPDSFRSLQSAAEQQLRNGAIFEFVGPGPYQVTPVLFNNLPGAPLQEITLRGDPQLRTTLLMTAHDDSEAWLRLVRGQLRLEQLDLVVMLPASSQSVPFRLLDLLDSDCQITACTWTVLTPAAGAQHRPCQALWLAGQSPLGNRVLLRDCVGQGEATAVNCTQAALDLVIGNCWLNSGRQPALVLRTDPPGTQLAGPPPARRLAVTASTLLGRNSLLQLVGGGGGVNTSAQPVELRFRRTNWVGTAADCCAIELLNWPRNPLKNLEAPVPAGVVLEQEHCRWWNIGELTRFVAAASDAHGPSAETVTDVTTWRQFWKQSLASTALRELEAEVAMAGQGSSQSALVDPLDLDAHLQLAGETLPSGAPFSGAHVHSLPRLNPRHGQLAAAAASRSRIPAAFGAFDQAAPIVRFDLNRSKQFNEFLNSSQCPSGATVICFGAGLKQLPPVLLVGKSLRIEFEQAGEGVSLELQPPPDSQAEAWFEVHDGELHLVNAPLSIPRTTRRQYPGTLLKLSDASASLQRCRLTGSASATLVPLLRQTSSADLCYLQILDSQLCAAGPLLNLPVTGLACEIINSLLATPATAVVLQESAPAAAATQLMLHHATVQAGESLVIASWPEAAPVQLFVKESVFLPAAGTTAPHVLALPGNRPPADRLRWWELGCGYTTGFQSWLAGTGSASGDWAEREELLSGMLADAVTGERGVVVIDPSAHPLDLLASNLRVREDCLAARWAEDGGPLGMRLPIGPELKVQESGKPASPTRPVPTLGRGRTIPDF
jgi:serine/threonine-protein kinase